MQLAFLDTFSLDRNGFYWHTISRMFRGLLIFTICMIVLCSSFIIHRGFWKWTRNETLDLLKKNLQNTPIYHGRLGFNLPPGFHTKHKDISSLDITVNWKCRRHLRETVTPGNCSCNYLAIFVAPQVEQKLAWRKKKVSLSSLSV